MKIEVDLCLLNQSAKRAFFNLRSLSPIRSEILDIEVLVSKRFFDHIAHHRRRKSNLKELVRRLLMIPFVPEIIEAGQIEEIRNKEEDCFIEISRNFSSRKFSVVLVQKKTSKVYYLLSCFEKTKNNLS